MFTISAQRVSMQVFEFKFWHHNGDITKLVKPCFQKNMFLNRDHKHIL